MILNDPYKILENIFLSALGRVDPYKMILDHLVLDGDILTVSDGTVGSVFDLSEYNRISLIGAGKASPRMAAGITEIIGDRIVEGIISTVCNNSNGFKHEVIRIIESGHPMPDSNSVTAAGLISGIAENAGENDLVIGLISGGGSSLLCEPYSDNNGYSITLEDKQAVSGLLLASGADIREINCVRKHLSGIKGGRLAAKIYPATSLNLILSDVTGDDLTAIASGLTVPDTGTYSDAMNILLKYGLDEKVPGAVLRLIESGVNGIIPETPKPGSGFFNKSHNIFAGSNRQALAAASDSASGLGITPVMLTSTLTGESGEIANFFAALGRDAARWRNFGDKPVCFIAGGETTVTLRGSGSGGRNQEMALAFLLNLAKFPEGCAGVYFLSAGTDGIDGPTDSAGAFGSLDIYEKAVSSGLNPLEYLKNNDSNTFFSRTGGLLKTGPTGTNVCDIQLLLII